jgi:hypothetical protein
MQRHAAPRLVRLALAASGVGVCVGLGACASGGNGDGGGDEDLLTGTIAYPFVDETKVLGDDRPADDRFVIRSAVGGREYTIEIPGAARDYDVQVPLADLGESDDDVLSGKRPKAIGSPVATDQEMVATMPQLQKDRATDTALMDSAFGAGGAEGPRQAPSYTLGLAKVNELYKRRQYEFALVELNNMIAFYPNSPKLQKMKGTVLVKMRNLPLAELAWIKALELDPRDKGVRAALARLQKRLVQTGAAPAGLPLDQDIPKPIGTVPPAQEPALGH